MPQQTRSTVDALLGAVEWDKTAVAAGSGGDVPDRLRKLLMANTDEAAERAYWQLDNWVVVQGQVFTSGQRLMPSLVAAAHSSKPPVRRWVLELVYEIAAGFLQGEVIDDKPVRAEGCARDAQAGLGLFRELLVESAGAERAVAMHLVALLDDAASTRRPLLDYAFREDSSPEVARAAKQLSGRF